MIEKSLYERLGGVFAIAAVVDHFSDAVVNNPIVGKSSKNQALREWHTKRLDRLPGLKFMTEVFLTDGGVYDNLGLETVWKRYDTVLVSDGGGKLAPEEHPKSDWARHAIRVNELIDNQVRSLRKRLLLESYRDKQRNGTYWGIRSHVADYHLPDPLPCPPEKTLLLANTPTRLKRLDSVVQERLINWGYAICDAAMRTWVDPNLQKRAAFPYPSSGVG